MESTISLRFASCRLLDPRCRLPFGALGRFLLGARSDGHLHPLCRLFLGALDGGLYDLTLQSLGGLEAARAATTPS